MTKEQYDRVKRFKPQFELAKGGFCRIARGELEVIRNVYNEVFEQSLGQANMNCNACVIKMMRNLGEAVEKYEKYLNTFGRKKKTEPSRDSNDAAQNEAGEGIEK